jgi:hypothetical protein
MMDVKYFSSGGWGREETVYKVAGEAAGERRSTAEVLITRFRDN